jgi:hypothetical protein
MNYCPWLLLLGIAAFTGCQRHRPEAVSPPDDGPTNEIVELTEEDASTMPRLPDLDRILEALHSNDEKVREAAKTDLLRLRHQADRLSAAQGLKVLRAAAQPYAFEKPSRDEVSEYLVDVAATHSRSEYAPVVVELFDQFSDKAKWWALVILASLEEREAAVAYMEVVRQHGEAGRIPQLVTGPLEKKPRHADVYFPELLRYARVTRLSADVYRLCLAYGEAELLSPKTLAPFAGQVVDAYRALAEKLRPAQRDKGVAWMWEEPYTDGRFDAETVEADLRRALEYRDPRLKSFAIASLLRLGKAVDAKHVAAVAAHAEMRNWLYQALHKRGQLALYPEKHRTQAAFAEADMVDWLTFPTELGRVPDKIELMKVVSVDTGLPGGVYDYYLFRFCTHEPHWAAKDGWMAGVSGPFRRKDLPTPASLGDTFSTFTKWESKTPEEHVGDIHELMQRWREYHAK